MKTRLYSIVNQYISGIHAGIQTAHAVHELFIKYPQGTNSATNLLWDWAVRDKTIIVLEGGYQSNLEHIFELAKAVKSLPSAKFHEELDALNGALTAITIVLPEYMYAPQYATEIDEPGAWRGCRTVGLQIANQFKDLETGNVLHNYTQPEKELIASIKALRLKGA